MEYWELKVDDGLIFYSDLYHLYKNRFHSSKRGSSVFQPSSIPSFQGVFSRYSQFSNLAPMTRFSMLESISKLQSNQRSGLDNY